DYLLQYGDDQHIVFLNKREQITYHDLREACARLLGELKHYGVQPGDRVGILGDNSLFWAASYLAILKLGTVAVPFPTVSTPDDFQRKERFVQCNVMCVEQRAHRKFAGAFNEKSRLILDDVFDNQGPSIWETIQEDFDLDQDAALMLTSGTTAQPRAVRITHRNIQANTNSIIEYLDLDNRERILVVLPFYYCFGTSLLHTHLRVGGSLALCNTFAYPETALEMIESTGATGFAGVPSTYQTLLRNTSFPKRQFKTLRKVQQAGGKLPDVFIRELIEALPEVQIFVMYGQTEATARLSYLPPSLLSEKLGSIGRGIPGVSLQVVNEDGKEVSPGEVGEIAATGDNISPGYYKDPKSTVDKFIEGQLQTGDLAKVDEDGFIFIVDRKSDFIKSLGHRVSSQEVEAKILQLPEVVSAAAIGVPDELQGEAIRVFVTLQAKSSLSVKEIIEYCRKNLARHMVPKEVFVIDRLPLNAHGKVVKSRLREWEDVALA
ncbi:MAG: AMP-binding protein, partial [Anaerolineales bacterium]